MNQARRTRALGQRLRAVVPSLAWYFCLLTGPPLVLSSLLAFVWADTGFATGDNLPHNTWPVLFVTNDWHQLFHIVTAAPLIVAIFKRQWAPLAAIAFGVMYILPTPFALIDGDDLANVVYLNTLDNIIHTLLGLEGLVIGLLSLRAQRRLPSRVVAQSAPAYDPAEADYGLGASSSRIAAVGRDGYARTRARTSLVVKGRQHTARPANGRTLQQAASRSRRLG